MRLPGKKIRTELFHVDGAAVVVELRLLDDGQFFCAPDDRARFEAPSVVELRAKLKPHLEATRRLTFEPYIDVEYNSADRKSQFDNHCRDENREEVRIHFTAGWLSSEQVNERRRWIATNVDEETAEIEPLSSDDRAHRYSSVDGELIPFTPDRWRRLCAIQTALADVRKKIADVLSDTTGKKLEAMNLPRLLEAPKRTKR